MHKIINYLEKELDRLEEKIERNGELSKMDLECGDLQAHFLKSLLIVEPMLNDAYSYGGGNSNGYSGRRDSMGRYTDGGSYARYNDGGYSGRRYSREEGRSYMANKLEKMMEDAPSEEERQVLQQAMDRLKNM